MPFEQQEGSNALESLSRPQTALLLTRAGLAVGKDADLQDGSTGAGPLSAGLEGQPRSVQHRWQASRTSCFAEPAWVHVCCSRPCLAAHLVAIQR